MAHTFTQPPTHRIEYNLTMSVRACVRCSNMLCLCAYVHLRSSLWWLIFVDMPAQCGRDLAHTNRRLWLRDGVGVRCVLDCMPHASRVDELLSYLNYDLRSACVLGHRARAPSQIIKDQSICIDFVCSRARAWWWCCVTVLGNSSINHRLQYGCVWCGDFLSLTV